ncbi:U3 snoRNP-associated protein-like YAOH [Porphyridium purpureum]|uniref:U3 snoRNP-associated protein-like YAOH n=1 Tax=Porphyridium purpureum TaxID=35688 RepID=A0A5J4Z605_PORPP|nr:U3 snoRNP-associated protein-like YAOH [Porphyridium purpureum]|eukprot:POR1961..scf295_1
MKTRKRKAAEHEDVLEDVVSSGGSARRASRRSAAHLERPAAERARSDSDHEHLRGRAPRRGATDEAQSRGRALHAGENGGGGDLDSGSGGTVSDDSASTGGTDDDGRRARKPAFERNAEDAQAHRLKLAKKYLDDLGLLGEDGKPKSKLKRTRDAVPGFSATAATFNGLGDVQDSEASDDDAEEEDIQYRKDAEALKRRTLQESGRQLVPVAARLHADETKHAVSIKRGHRLPATCVAISEDESRAVTGSKDKSLVLWDTETQSVLQVMHGAYASSRAKKTNQSGNTKDVLAVAMTEDGRTIASGGRDRVVRIWDARAGGSSCGGQVEQLKGHRGAVTALSFRSGTAELYSASEDRTVKVWNARETSYLETLFGHTAEVYCVDNLLRHRAVSGGRDGTLRQWKIPEDTQLVFRSPAVSTDALSMVDEANFISGGDDGALYAWNVAKKKPVSVIANAHGSPNHWISAVAAARFSDICASGSSDGRLRIWALESQGRRHGMANSSELGFYPRTLVSRLSLPVPGFVNGLVFGKSRRRVFAAVGQEHRLGRWTKVSKCVNGLAIVNLRISDE